MGDMVVIKDIWRLDRITELLSGPDQVVKEVKVLTRQDIIARPVVKIVLLPTE